MVVRGDWVGPAHSGGDQTLTLRVGGPPATTSYRGISNE